jgi:hypothetical protein
MDNDTTIHLSPSEASDFVLFRKYAALFHDMESAGVFQTYPARVVLTLDGAGVLIGAEIMRTWRRKKTRLTG